MLNPDRYLSSDPSIRGMARSLYQDVVALPIISPHGHIDPLIFSDPDYVFGTPTDLFILQDHDVRRLLLSQGVNFGTLNASGLCDHRSVWRIFCENFYRFRGTPTGIWLINEMSDVFSVTEKPSMNNADNLYDMIADKLSTPQFSPRELFKRFNIEVLCTTDMAIDSLDQHRILIQSGWKGKVIPTFRPDDVIQLDTPNWQLNIQKLGKLSGLEIGDYDSYIAALEKRRDYYRLMGAKATDIDAPTPTTRELTRGEVNALFQRALHGKLTQNDVIQFNAHMLIEMARMSIDDGLVMQIHAGSLRNHNQNQILSCGLNNVADIPTQTEFTRNLRPLLNKFGNDSRLTLIVFTLDESAYSRELAPLAGHYSSLKLGPPWWFHDSLNGIARYFDQVIETAGFYNTVGFNDDASTLCSIPSRHDVWRRVSANWLAGLVVRHLIDESDAFDMIKDLAIGLAKRTYKLEG